MIFGRKTSDGSSPAKGAADGTSSGSAFSTGGDDEIIGNGGEFAEEAGGTSGGGNATGSVSGPSSTVAGGFNLKRDETPESPTGWARVGSVAGAGSGDKGARGNSAAGTSSAGARDNRGLRRGAEGGGVDTGGLSDEATAGSVDSFGRGRNLSPALADPSSPVEDGVGFASGDPVSKRVRGLRRRGGGSFSLLICTKMRINRDGENKKIGGTSLD